MDERLRVRFAPSPTGLLHVGNARTALFNFLWARKRGGVFVLRVEDTDVDRSTAEAGQSIQDDLQWLGLEWDEGPGRPGEYGPYRQSERLEIYRRYASQLLEKGSAYRCFCTPEELEEKRKRFLARGTPPRYDGRCRNLSPEEAQSLAAEGRPASLRFKVETRMVEFEDLVKGRMSFDTHGFGDFVILRSDGFPPYNFAVVVDDALMAVTHVIRGEDHVTNTPRQILLYQALNFSPPRFAHLPMILGPDRTPLSKRHGATSVAYFREEGYLPEALVNYLALLGWSSEDGGEIFTPAELCAKFSLNRVSRSSAVFDPEKLKWVNRAHMKRLAEGLAVPGSGALVRIRPFLERAGIRVGDQSDPWLVEVLGTAWAEVNTLSELADRVKIFFDEVWTLEPEAGEFLAREESQKVVSGLVQEIQGVPEINAETYKRLLAALGKRVSRSGRNLLMPLRAALTGRMRGPELERIFTLLGKEKVRERAERALQRGA